MVPGDVDAKGKFCVGDIAYDIGLAPPCGFKEPTVRIRPASVRRFRCWEMVGRLMPDILAIFWREVFFS